MVILAIIFMSILSPEYVFSEKERRNRTSTDPLSEWICVKNSQGINVYERWVYVNDSLSVRERKGEMVVRSSLKRATGYLSNRQTIKKWMKGVQEVYELASPLASGEMSYVIMNLPWPITNRDMTARYRVFEVDAEHCVVSVKSEEGYVPEADNLKRIHDYRASWTLEKVDANRTKIEFVVFSDEAPLFPQWLQEPLIKKVFFGNLVKLKSELSENKE